MTVPKTNYERGILNGTTESPKTGIYETSTVQEFKLGTVMRTPDGKTFRYAQAGAVALVAGNLIQQATLAGAKTTAQTSLAVATAGAIGDDYAYATILTTAQVADAFRDGYYVIENGAADEGFGQMYPIDAHGALAVESSKIPLQEVLRTATTTSTTVRLIANMYKGVIQAPATASGASLGVARIAVPASSFFWLQTYGEASVLVGAAMTVGNDVVRDDTTAGAVMPFTYAADVIITPDSVGCALATIADTECGPIFLTIAP